MIPIILSNKETIEVENESSKTAFILRTDSFSEIDTWKEKITEENINGAEMEGETLSDLKFEGVAVELENHSLKTVFSFREKTKEEIMSDRISELEDAVNFLLMGGDE